MEKRQPLKGAPGSKQNFIQRMLKAVAEFFAPKSNEKKKARKLQLRNVAIFVVSTLALILLEDQLKKWVSRETEELQMYRRQAGAGSM